VACTLKYFDRRMMIVISDARAINVSRRIIDDNYKKNIMIKNDTSGVARMMLQLGALLTIVIFL
jgi:hypothetical protein